MSSLMMYSQKKYLSMCIKYMHTLKPQTRRNIIYLYKKFSRIFKTTLVIQASIWTQTKPTNRKMYKAITSYPLKSFGDKK